MDGYPDCTTAAPVPCTAGTAYGDISTNCSVGNGTNFSNDSNGQSREMRFRCDGSPGMSGAPIYTGALSACAGGARCVLGQYNSYSCVGTACGSSVWVNTMGRLTVNYASVLAMLNANNP